MHKLVLKENKIFDKQNYFKSRIFTLLKVLPQQNIVG